MKWALHYLIPIFLIIGITAFIDCVRDGGISGFFRLDNIPLLIVVVFGGFALHFVYFNFL